MLLMRLLCFGVTLVFLVTAFGLARADDAPDLRKVDRRIAKEPVYKAKPLYGLYVFGPEARTRVWAILDKSKADASDYDVLYFDRNADGDLTAPGERIEGKGGPGNMTFDIGAFIDPVSKQKHTKLSIGRRGDGSVMLSMNWCDKVMIRGGYAPEAGPYTQFAATPAAAPVLWPGADGPFSFQFWVQKALTIGTAEDVRVFLGHQGIGPNTFCAVPDTFLPKSVPVMATLVYKDKTGKERRELSKLHDRC
jgi:hypothetical protein